MNDNPHLSRRTEDSTAPDQNGLPDLKDSANECCARPAEKPVFTFHVIMPDGTTKSFQYAHLESNSNFTPEYISIKFSGPERWQVQIYGRNLWRLYGLLHDHRMRWIRKASRDMGQEDKGEAVVTDVRITPLLED